MGELLLGIDVGTYSSKGVLVTPAGEVLRSAVVEHGLDLPEPGWAEHDADGVWWHDVVALCRQLLDGAPYRGADVAGVAISAIGPCLLPLDADGRPLRKGILYGVDTRATEEIASLNERWGQEAIFAFSGMRADEPGDRAQDPVAEATRAGGVGADPSASPPPAATSSTGLPATTSSTATRRATTCRCTTSPDTRGRRATPTGSSTSSSCRGSRGATRWRALSPRRRPGRRGSRVGTPVAVGAVDALSEAVSVGVVEPGDLMVMYGSTTFFILVLDGPQPNPVTWMTAGAFAGQYALAAGMSTTGALTRWFRDELARDLPEDVAYARLFAEAAEIAPGAGGLLLLPYFSGERTPIDDPRARGVIAGLDLRHHRAHLFRAALEGVAYGIRHNLESFAAIGAKVGRVVAVGGGAQGDTWLRIVSDVAGVTQEVPARTIGASLGDAFLAGLATGRVRRGDLADWVGAARRIEPDPRLRDRYDAGYADYLELYRATRDVVHRLAGGRGDHP